MQVSATRTISNLAAGILFLAGLFLFVIVLQIAVLSALRGLGVGGGLALLISGAAILGGVLGATFGVQALGKRARAQLDARREALGLPDGPCCVVWKPGKEGEFPWEITGDVRAVFPPIARRCGVEGYAVIDFEISADGAPKSLHCVDVWPSRLFYDSAARALSAARFRVREGAPPRFGPSYRIPFVFRIRGAARVSDPGRSALGPILFAVKTGLEAFLRLLGQLGGVLLTALKATPGVSRRLLGRAAHATADGLEALAARLRNLKGS